MLYKMLTIAALSYAGFGALVFLLQKRLIFQPSRELAATPESAGIPYRDLTLKTADGAAINAWFTPALDGGNGEATILFCHGNAGNLSHRLDTIAMFRTLGMSSLFFDYRGYGRSGGHITEAGLYEDAAAAWRYLTETRGIRPADIVIIGRSLGGAVAADLASKVPCRALVLESAFVSVPDMARRLYPFLPAGLLCRYRLPTRDRLRTVAAPKLIVYSGDDEMVPAACGEALFEAAGGVKDRLILSGDHNNCYFSDADAYLGKLGPFIRGAGAGKSGP